MSEVQYQVVFSGQLRSGFSQEQVKQNLIEQLKIPADKVESLFSQSRAVVKRNLDFATANKYEQQFFLQGLIAKPESMAISSAAKFAVDSNERATFAQEAEKRAESSNSQPPQTPPSAPSSEETNGHNGEYPQVMPFEFTGSGKEYFKIWIVNLLLTIVTLGIYSAWAKVRNKQYFYGNTFLDGSSFEYTAKPLQILKGRLVAAAVIGLYYGISYLLPPDKQIIFIVVMGLFLMGVIPWVVVQGLKFNARYSNYRNIPFGFDGTYGGAFKAFILWPLAGITIVLIPFAWHRKNRFFVDNSRYGTEAFQFTAEVGDYYRIFGMMFLLGLGVGLASFVIGLAGALLTFISPLLGPIIGVLAYLAMYFVLFAYFESASNNLMYNSTNINQHSLSSNYDVLSYMWMLIKNTLCILTFFGIPWAMVRTARYHADKTHLVAAESLNTVVAAESEKVNSLGEGFADAHDVFDIGVGI